MLDGGEILRCVPMSIGLHNFFPPTIHSNDIEIAFLEHGIISQISTLELDLNNISHAECSPICRLGTITEVLSWGEQVLRLRSLGPSRRYWGKRRS